MNAYTSICAWFASKGYIVVSVQHDHDEICVDDRHLPRENLWKIRDFTFQKRNKDLTTRVAEVSKIVKAINENNFFKEHLGEDI